MLNTRPDDILLPGASDATDRVPSRGRIVAFVPITIAIIGVAAILIGRVSVQEIAKNDTLYGIDPIATGAISAVEPVDYSAR